MTKTLIAEDNAVNRELLRELLFRSAPNRSGGKGLILRTPRSMGAYDMGTYFVIASGNEDLVVSQIRGGLPRGTIETGGFDGSATPQLLTRRDAEQLKL
jgi:hypothetical protein